MTKSLLSTIAFMIVLAFTFQSCENETQKTDKINEEKKHSNKLTQNKQESIKILIPTDDVTKEFYDAIFENNSEKVRQMLETTFPADYEPKGKIPPLQAVIWTADNLYLARLLIEGGANINNEENPAVLVAAEYKRIEILKYLIEKDSDLKNNEAFNKAGFHQFYEGARLLLLNGANQEKGDIRGKLWVFHQAIKKSDYEVLNAMKLTNDELNHNEYNGETALIIAVKNNNIKMVEYLLEKNVDKNKPETFDGGDDIYYGKSPIQIAEDNKFQDIIKILK